MSTPTKAMAAKPASTPVSKKEPQCIDSPGNWRHPRLAEISRRKVASTFTERNISRIAYNLAVLFILWGASLLLTQYTPFPKLVSSSLKAYIGYAYKIVQLVPAVNIGLAMLPLVRKPDDFSDIPLTPGQRKLLGLPPSSAPPTSDAVFSTPPRYSRTPSMSGSVGSRNSYSGSPLSGRGSPVPAGSPSLATFSPIPASPLLQKAVGGSGPRRSSFGSPSPLGVSTASSLFPESPSPSPVGMGKRSSIGLNNKWLYERGRRSSSQNWYS